MRNETLWEEMTVTLTVIRNAQCRKLIAILNEGRNVTKLGAEVEMREAYV